MAGVVIAVGLVAAACGNSEDDTSSETTAAKTDETTDATVDSGSTDEFVPVDAPGVSDDTIRVGGVASVTSPIGASYGDTFDGTKAYFEMINSQGGIWDRQLELVAERDDMTAQNQPEVQGLLAQDDVFAVLPVNTLLFTGAVDLVESGTPTFGWNIQEQWSEGPNLFGEKGSFLCFTCTSPLWPWLADQIGADSVGILAYGNSAQSADAAEGFEKSFEAMGDAEVGYFDTSLSFGVPDLSAQVAAMDEAGVDLVLTAMDQNGVTTLQREMAKQELDAIQLLSNAYDPVFIEEFGELFEGSYAQVQFWPFEEETDQPEGLTNYLEWMDETDGTVNEISMAAWLATDLFVTGLREAGPDFGQQEVTDAINAITLWDAQGANPGFDWTIAHDRQQPETCYAFVEVTRDGYVPTFGEPGSPFSCLDASATDHVPEATVRP